MSDHGLCGCKACFEAGKWTPLRPWVLTRVEKLQYGGVRLTGENLYCPPGKRVFHWSFTIGSRPFNDSRYDATNAVIDADALKEIERMGSAQPLPGV